MSKFQVGDKVRYTNWPNLSNMWIQAIIYETIDRSRFGKSTQYLLLHYARGRDYGPYRSTVSDDTPTLELDPDPPVAKSKWE